MGLSHSTRPWAPNERETTMQTKTEYVIPGLGDVGTIGNRRPINTQGIAEVMTAYRNGEGMHLKPSGMPATRNELGTTQTSALAQVPTSMGYLP
jgi:hypothetical protein